MNYTMVEFISGNIAKSICKKKLWEYDSNTMFGVEKKGTLISIFVTLMVVLTMYLIHPVIFMVIHILPQIISIIFSVVCSVLVVIDFFTILYVIHVSNNVENIEKIKQEKQEGKKTFGKHICYIVLNRLNKAYPDIVSEEKDEERKSVFAKGICLDKFIWVFLICAFGGDIIETIFCRITGGVWMSRSSVIYGPFSLVWGIGAALLTLVLQKLAYREDRYVFVAGCILGGVYEYVCSVFTEVFFGTVFWDYSHMRFNLGGRINLLYCIFWGIVAVVWIKICYPAISRFIERIPPLGGKIVTWVIMVLMICNILISAMAMSRYVDRKAGDNGDNAIEEFIDYYYPDSLVEKIWPNMKIK